MGQLIDLSVGIEAAIVPRIVTVIRDMADTAAA